MYFYLSFLSFTASVRRLISEAYANSPGLPLAKGSVAILHGLGGYNKGTFESAASH
jgi:hypothetical protein